MPRPSSIAQLPADILEQLQALLRDPRVTQMEATRRINAVLEEIGEGAISKSAVNRYAVRMEEVGARLRQSREMASMWIGKLGQSPQGEVGQLLNEVVRTLAFETTMHLAEGDDPVAPDMLNKLALAVQRLEAAANLSQEREKKIRDEERKRVAEEAANKVDKTLSGQGASREFIDGLKAELLGL